MTDQTKLESQVLIKITAANWAECFLDNTPETPKEVQEAILSQVLVSEKHDKQAINILNKGIDLKWTSDDIVVKRFSLFGMKITLSALSLLMMLVKKPGDVSMLVAVIASVIKTDRSKENNLVTLSWLKETLFKGKYPNAKTYSDNWNSQKLENCNLVDLTWAFEPLTNEELDFLNSFEPKQPG